MKVELLRYEFIVCSNCKQKQLAKVEGTVLWNSYVHNCDECDYWIGESEWEPIGGNLYYKVWDEKYNYIGEIKVENEDELLEAISLLNLKINIIYELQEPFL